MSWNYRLLTPKGKWLPRFAEVYYSDEGVPEFWSIHKYFKDILWAIRQPLVDAFRRKPLKESDFVESKDEFEFATVLTVQKDGEDYFIELPDELTDQLNWLPQDEIAFTISEMCLDTGEYPTLIMENRDLERRMAKGE